MSVPNRSHTTANAVSTAVTAKGTLWRVLLGHEEDNELIDWVCGSIEGGRRPLACHASGLFVAAQATQFDVGAVLLPIALRLVRDLHALSPQRRLVVGVTGPAQSGKTILCDLLCRVLHTLDMQSSSEQTDAADDHDAVRASSFGKDEKSLTQHEARMRNIILPEPVRRDRTVRTSRPHAGIAGGGQSAELSRLHANPKEEGRRCVVLSCNTAFADAGRELGELSHVDKSAQAVELAVLRRCVNLQASKAMQTAPETLYNANYVPPSARILLIDVDADIQRPSESMWWQQGSFEGYDYDSGQLSGSIACDSVDLNFDVELRLTVPSCVRAQRVSERDEASVRCGATVPSVRARAKSQVTLHLGDDGLPRRRWVLGQNGETAALSGRAKKGIEHRPTSVKTEGDELELSVLACRGAQQPRPDTGGALPAPQLRTHPRLPQPHPLPKVPRSRNAHLVMLHDGRTTIRQHATRQLMENSDPEDLSTQVQGLGFYDLQGVEYQASQVSSTVDVTVTHAQCCDCAKRWSE